MLGYAKLFKDKILAQGRAEGRAEGKAEVYRELLQAQREGITLEELLKTHDAQNGKDDRKCVKSVSDSNIIPDVYQGNKYTKEYFQWKIKLLELLKMKNAFCKLVWILQTIECKRRMYDLLV